MWSILLLMLVVGDEGPGSKCSEWPDQRPPTGPARIGEGKARLAVARVIIGRWNQTAAGNPHQIVWLDFDRLLPSEKEAQSISTDTFSVRVLYTCQSDSSSRDCRPKNGIMLFVRAARWCSDTQLLLDAGSYTNGPIGDEMGCSYRATKGGDQWIVEVTKWCWAE